MEIEKKSMESGSPSPGNYNVRLYARMLAALLCFILVLFSFLFLNANSQASASNQRPGPRATTTLTTIITSTATLTTTTRSTATSTPTPTATATNTPTPTPTATSTPKPTPTPTRHPRPTPTARPTTAAATPTATATGVQATSTVGTVTASSSTGQTPTSVPTGSATATTTTTTTNNTGTARTGPPASGFGIAFFPFIAGSLVFLGIVSVFLIGLLLLRKRLLPPQPVPVNLPPSGAQPWRRVRSGSLHSHTDIAGDSLQDSGPTLSLPPMAATDNQQDQSSLAAAMTQPQYVPTSDFLVPRTASVPNIDDFAPINIDAHSSEPITGEVKPVTRMGTRLVKLEEKRY